MACKHWRKKTSDVHCLGAWSLQCVLMLLFTSCHTNRGSLALLPGKSHGQRSLVGCSPWGCEESDTTERLHFHFHALKAMATHSSVLAWRIPGKGEPGGLPSMGLHRVGHDWSDLAAAAADFSGELWDEQWWAMGWWAMSYGMSYGELKSVRFSRQEYLSWLPCSPPRDLLNPRIEPVSPALQINSLPLSHWGSPERQ